MPVVQIITATILDHDEFERMSLAGWIRRDWKESVSLEGNTYANTNKLLMEQDPGQQVDQCRRAGKESHHNRGVDIGQ